MSSASLPRILVIDDLFGREVPGATNRERESLCGKFLLAEVSVNGGLRSARFEIPNPTAHVAFCRGQIPVMADVGSLVENDLQTALQDVRLGWTAALSKGEVPWSMVLLDLCFYTGRVTKDSHRRTPGMPEGQPGDDDPRNYFGLTLLEEIHREFPDLPIFILSSKPRDEVSLKFSQRGALGFIARDDLRGPELLEEAIWQHGLLPDPAGDLVGNSLAMLLALREARRAARHRENLLIRGERGTGKELLARYVHLMSDKINEGGGRPFVAVNSAVFTPNLFASELFGIEPRTATGVDSKIGLVEMAHQGDLFLDEIADMPLEVQAAVLRVLQERQITRIGSRQSKNVDVRFLSATNAELENETRGFRSDLLDRLRLGGTVWVPPLRERPTDIPLLVETFVREAEGQHKGSQRRDITPESVETLQAHDWPGNIRQLRSVVFDAVSRFPDVEHLVPGHLRIGAERKGQRTETSTRKTLGTGFEEPNVGSQEAGLGALLRQLPGIKFNAQDVSQWAGKYEELQHEHARLAARMFQAALDATKRRTPERPDGFIQIQPAVKLLTGDTTITASRAADIIKRLLGPLEDELEGDLREAFAIAIRLRPRSSKAMTATT